MKAAVFTRYGSLDVVQIMDVEKPVPKDNAVLIKVRAASVNPLDWRLMKGGSHLHCQSEPTGSEHRRELMATGKVTAGSSTRATG